MIQSSDAVICVGGRLGTLNEFIIAAEQRKVVGVLIDSGGSSDVIGELLEILQPQFKHLVVFESNPEYLVERISDILAQEYSDVMQDLTMCFDWMDTDSDKNALKSHNG
jgi:predicted Rossmann-fold nucleotide-binding protein